jgi:hypothetical protein
VKKSRNDKKKATEEAFDKKIEETVEREFDAMPSVRRNSSRMSWSMASLMLQSSVDKELPK